MTTRGRTPRADADELYAGLVKAELTQPDVALGRALQNEVLQVSGKIFAFLKTGRLVVKLPAERVRELIAAGGAVPFTSGVRVMKEWVCVDVPPGAAGKAFWCALAGEARHYVAGAAPKPRG
ncbi:MAG: hypothetical protein JWN27_104 [Candidatus Eremiobacteraeota bacterium]|nr:hypothetical protein [Candidatus Eremiobacteraeota bacterium]